ncbi:MAG TPA: cupin domain-containing protein [Solirubrobacteraceae bacterium]|nr:cupin domain-containing protein [Solirubrobacteraceae bacterium]
MSEPIVISPGGGEIVGEAPDRRVEILCDHDALHATWSRFGAGRDGADLHVHHHHTDLFYVLEGELTLRLGVEGETVTVPAGTLARVPPDVVHGFRNASDADVRYLNLHAPGRQFANYMRALRDGRTPPTSYDQHPPPPDGGRPTSEAVIGGHEIVSDEAGLRVTMLADVDALRVAEVLREPGSGSTTHAHPDGFHSDGVRSFYVLTGELALTSGDRDLRAQRGSWLQLSPGIAHALSGTGATPLRYLDLRSPAA